MTDNKTNSLIIAKVLHGARWAAILRFGAQVVSWGSTLVVVRYVSATDYGLNSMLEAPLEMLLLLSTLGLDLALVRSRVVNTEAIRAVFGWLLVINAALFVVYYFGSSLLASYFNEPRLEPLAQAMGFLLLLVPFRVVPNALLDRELKFKLRGVVELVSSVVAALTSVVLAVQGFGVWALVASLIVNRTLLTLLLMVVRPWIAMPSLSLRPVRGMLATGGALTLASALAVGAGMLPVVLAGPLLGPAALGLYTVALHFAMLPLSKLMPIINAVAFPAFSRFEGTPTLIGGYVQTCLRGGAFVFLPVTVGLACASEAFSTVVLGAKWIDAARPLAALSLAMPFRGVALFVRQVAVSVGRSDIALKGTAAIWIVGLPSVLFGARFGLVGLVAAYALTEVASCVITLALARQPLALTARVTFNAFKSPMQATGLMAVVVLGCAALLQGAAPPVVLLAQVSVGAVTYLAVLRQRYWDEARQVLLLFKP